MFSDWSQDYLTVKLIGDDLSAHKQVWFYRDFPVLIELLDTLAAYERNWDGRMEFCSIDGDFALAFRANRLGHVFVSITISKQPEWSVDCTIQTELGQLPLIARSARTAYSRL